MDKKIKTIIHEDVHNLYHLSYRSSTGLLKRWGLSDTISVVRKEGTRNAPITVVGNSEETKLFEIPRYR
jgi:hypothetical protein